MTQRTFNGHKAYEELDSDSMFALINFNLVWYYYPTLNANEAVYSHSDIVDHEAKVNHGYFSYEGHTVHSAHQFIDLNKYLQPISGYHLDTLRIILN